MAGSLHQRQPLVRDPLSARSGHSEGHRERRPHAGDRAATRRQAGQARLAAVGRRSEYGSRSLPFAQHRRRIEPSGAADWDPRGEDAHRDEHRCRAGERHRVARLQIEQQSLHESCRPEPARQS